MLPKRATKEINEYNFKTPVDLTITTHTPERLFVEGLCKSSVSSVIEAWIKSRDTSFYQIPYSVKKGGKDSKTRSYSHRQFNPDYFVKINSDDMEHYIVVETKEDKDISEENIAKYKAAKNHFIDLNDKLKKEGIKQNYVFNFLSPSSYPNFFEYVKDLRIVEGKFKSELEIMLEEAME